MQSISKVENKLREVSTFVKIHSIPSTVHQRMNQFYRYQWKVRGKVEFNNRAAADCLNRHVSAIHLV